MLKVTDDKTARRHPPLRIHPAAAPVLQPPAGGGQSAALRTQCLKFKTDQAVDLKKLDKMNGLFLAFMGRGVSSNAGALPPPGALTMTRLPHLAASCSHRSRLVVQLHCGRLRKASGSRLRALFFRLVAGGGPPGAWRCAAAPGCDALLPMPQLSPHPGFSPLRCR